ncbi:hypothetical protein F5148DRAFT_1169204 [Russula earlei]|uniref:Uncharacterized protein n=1 Tax=Russula earlei TaxID=71964 RepID=A0ACC0UKS2_9AGAM|nr:hypothetical protein F5148DRAFT_1169204 [Russula earlei]
MRTSSVFAIFCLALAIGITSSSNAQPHSAQPLRPLDEAPPEHKKALSAVHEQWKQISSTIEPHYRRLPNQDSVIAFGQYGHDIKQLRNNLRELHDIYPTDLSQGWLNDMIDEQREKEGHCWHMKRLLKKFA